MKKALLSCQTGTRKRTRSKQRKKVRVQGRNLRHFFCIVKLRAGQTAEDKPERRRKGKPMFDIIKKLFSLTTFGDGGGAGGGAAGGEGSTGEGTNAAVPGDKPGQSGRKAAAPAEDLSAVKYGKQEAEEAQQPEAEPEEAEKPAEPAKRQTFDELLKADPEYQREMQKRIDQAINRRFAKSKATEEQMSQLAPALNLLATKYGLQAGDTQALIEAINNDGDLIDQQAMDAGMEPEAYREFQRMKAELNTLKAERADRERQEAMQQKYTEWRRQEADVQRMFPDMRLDTEIQNQQFSEMLASGIDVMTAYKVVHMDEISQGLVRNAAADAQKETLAKIQQRTNRPREGAAGKPQSATVRADVSKLTMRDFDEIMRRAARGDVIRF